jgi:DNA-binding NarL/FixJ family response regulator
MQAARRTTVALADDQALVRSGLGLVLADFPDIEVMHECASGAALLAAVAARPVDVIVSDIRMPGMSGVQMVRELRARADRTPVILLTTFYDPGLLQAALQAGAQGYLLKDDSAEALHEALLGVAAGGTLFQPVTPTSVRESWAGQCPLPEVAPLGEREVQILRLIAGGYSNKEIARSLQLAEGTVKNYISELLVKLDSRDRTHAVLSAITRRLL